MTDERRNRPSVPVAEQTAGRRGGAAIGAAGDACRARAMHRCSNAAVISTTGGQGQGSARTWAAMTMRCTSDVPW